LKIVNSVHLTNHTIEISNQVWLHWPLKVRPQAMQRGPEAIHNSTTPLARGKAKVFNSLVTFFCTNDLY
jgi:hypothetical protein